MSKLRSKTVITYYITSCRHSPLVHKTTTCGNVHITLLSLLELGHPTDNNFIQRILYFAVYEYFTLYF